MSGSSPRWTRLRRSAFRARQAILQARLGRRELLKLGLITSAGTLASIAGLSDRASADHGGDGSCGRSPRTTPFIQPLPIMPMLHPVPLSALDPAPRETPNHDINPDTGIEFEGRGRFNGKVRLGTDAFQFFGQFAPQQYFLTRMKEARMIISPELPEQA